MSKLVVSAEASPLFGNFLMVVSVSDEETGKPIQKLDKSCFSIHHMASLNHASAFKRKVTKVKESPAGFYILTLQPVEYQPQLPPGHYVFAVGVVQKNKIVQKAGDVLNKDKTKGSIKNEEWEWGQTIANGDLPPYGIWVNK